jgi:hypothetical protein
MKKKLKPISNTSDFSKAELPLNDENNILRKTTPQLPLDSKPMGLAESAYRLSLDLEKAYENPAIKAYMQAEEDRKALIQTSIDKWNEPSLQETIRKYEKLLKSPTLSMALEKSEEFDKYKSLFSNSLASNNLETARKALESFSPHLKSEYSATQSALEQLRKTLASPSIQNSISHLENLGIYESGLAKAAASIAKNEDLLGSAKSLANLGKSIASDSLNYKRAEQSKIFPEIVSKEYVPIKIPENPLPKQNAQIISILEILKEQNDTLITINSEFLNFERSDLDIQNNIILLMQSQQNSYEIMIEELKAQNNGIENQLKELNRQNDNLEKQLEQKAGEIADNKDANSFTRKLALWGIGISIFVGISSSIIPYHISQKEKLDNDSDNVKLLEAINNKVVENQKQDQLIKLIEEENKYLKKLAEKESK